MSASSTDLPALSASPASQLSKSSCHAAPKALRRCRCAGTGRRISRSPSRRTWRLRRHSPSWSDARTSRVSRRNSRPCANTPARSRSTSLTCWGMSDPSPRSSSMRRATVPIWPGCDRATWWAAMALRRSMTRSCAGFRASRRWPSTRWVASRARSRSPTRWRATTWSPMSMPTFSRSSNRPLPTPSNAHETRATWPTPGRLSSSTCAPELSSPWRAIRHTTPNCGSAASRPRTMSDCSPIARCLRR